MSYKKIAKKSKKTIRLSSFLRGIDSVSDDLVASISTAKECFNFDVNSGALTALNGFSYLGVKEFDGFWAVFQNSGYRKTTGKKVYSAIMVDETGLLMGHDFDEYGRAGQLYETSQDGFRFTSVPQMIEYKKDGVDAMLFSSPTDGLVVWEGKGTEPRKIENTPLITSMALHSERLFVTVKGRTDRVWFSSVLEPTEWDVSLDGAGYIGFSDSRGECEKIVAYGGYVYVFRSYGISRIRADGEQSEFVVEHVYTSGSKIIPSTISLCSNRIVFASDDGLFSFNGSSVVQILPKVTPILLFDKNSVSAFYRGKYYVACNIDDARYVGCEKESFVNSCMLVYDVYTDKYVLYRGIDVRYIAPLFGAGRIYLIMGQLNELCCTSDTLRYLGEKPLRKWKSPDSDFGIADKKMLKEILLYTDYDITIKVVGDGVEKQVQVKGKIGQSRVPINMTACIFSIEFTSSENDCRIASPSIIFY